MVSRTTTGKATLEKSDHEAGAWRALIERVPLPLGLVDRSGSFRFANAAALEFAGLDSPDLFRMVHAEDRQRLESWLAGLDRSKDPILLRYVGSGPGAQPLEAFLHPPPEREGGDGGSELLWIPTSVPGSESAVLQRLARVGESATLLAHEIRNPIAAIHLALRALANRLGQDERAALEGLALQLDGLESKLRSTLSFVRPLQLELERSDVAGVMENAIERIRPEADEKGVQLVCSLPDPPEEFEVDRNHLVDALVNLLQNAVQAVPDGGRVELAARRVAPDEIVLTIDDDGPGLPDSLAGGTFRPFRTTRSDGTGLGVALAEKTVREHGGRLQAEASGRLGGASFRMHLRIVPTQ